MEGNLLVSVVDDDRAAREAVTSLVKSFGFRVEGFASAEEFLTSDCIRECACLIADIRMPGMSGFDLFTRLRASGTPIPTVLITAYTDAATESEVVRAGVESYLAKPLRADELLRSIRGAIARRTGALKAALE